MPRSVLLFLSLLVVASLPAADSAAPALIDLTYSGDQSALEALDAEIVAAGTDTAKLAALETRLLADLRRATATFAARQAICQRLGAVLGQSAPKGGASTYKFLGAMLVDERDSDLARLALEQVPGAAVDALFVSALEKTTGRTRLALIDSVGRRKASGAVAALTPLLNGSDADASDAATKALGRIATAEAYAALNATGVPSPRVLGPARLQAVSSLPKADALRALREMQDAPGLPVHLRASAFRTSLDLDPASAPSRIAEVLGGTDWTFKEVALEATSATRTRERTTVLAGKLSTWDAPTQAAVIAALARDGEAVAVPAIVNATRHADATVRAEALTALGDLPGNREIVALLATAAAGKNPAEAKLARHSLSRLNGPDVSAAILAGAERGEAGLRIAYLEQFALRNLTEGLPTLLKCRTESDATIRAAAIGVLGDMAPASEQKPVMEWAMAATDDTEQTRALRALVNVTLRNPDTEGRGQPIYVALERAQPEAALRLMPVLARLGGAASADCAARLAVRNDAKIAEAAAATLGRWTDATALPAMATVAEQAAISSVRNTARDSAIRHFERNRETWTPATTGIVSRLLAVTKETAPRQKLLAVLARANDLDALKLADGLKSDPTVGDDARYAAAAIQAAVAGRPKVKANPESGVSNILDGKTSTRWSAPALGEEWVEIDFRQSRPLRRLTLDQTGRGAEFPEKYEVHVTDDPQEPGKAVVTGTGKSGKTTIELPAGTQGRYVIIKNTAERKETPWSICELYVD